VRAAVIDSGINKIEEEDNKGNLQFKTVGDVNFETAHDVTSWISPVQGGVRPATVPILMRNMTSETNILFR
jgi:5,10-methylene-tetrahydrofolate dehydrogenase/methenyl tetrahydrofolate cyclohydrolase